MTQCIQSLFLGSGDTLFAEERVTTRFAGGDTNAPPPISSDLDLFFLLLPWTTSFSFLIQRIKI